MSSLILWSWMLLMSGAVVIALCWPLTTFRWRSLQQQPIRLWVATLCLPLCAILLYCYLGASKDLQRYWQQQAAASAIASQVLAFHRDPEALLQQLQATVAEHPASAEGWYWLGRVYLSTQQSTEAFMAFKHAYQLQPNNPRILLSVAKAQLIAEESPLEAQTVVALQALLSQNWAQAEVLNILAMNAFRQRDYGKARAYWRRLLPQLAPGSRDQQVVLNLLTRVGQGTASNR